MGVGAYRLFCSRGYKGGLCIGLVLETAGPGGRPNFGEGCGGPEDMNIGKVTAADESWTIVHGKVPKKADKASANKADGTTVALPVIDDEKGVDGKFVVKKLHGKLGEVDFMAEDAGSRTLEHEHFAP